MQFNKTDVNILNSVCSVGIVISAQLHVTIYLIQQYNCEFH